MCEFRCQGVGWIRPVEKWFPVPIPLETRSIGSDLSSLPIIGASGV
jgi:hypothetical protein